jgi:hypothetical protein
MEILTEIRKAGHTPSPERQHQILINSPFLLVDTICSTASPIGRKAEPRKPLSDFRDPVPPCLGQLHSKPSSLTCTDMATLSSVRN